MYFRHPVIDVVSEKKIWTILDSAGTQDQKLGGTNHVTLLFSKNLVVHMNCTFCLIPFCWVLHLLGIHRSMASRVTLSNV